MLILENRIPFSLLYLSRSPNASNFLNLEHHWVDWAQTKRSYELIARCAIPKICKLNRNRLSSDARLRKNNDQFRGLLTSDMRAKMEEHATSNGAEKLSPDLVEYFSDAKSAG